jgi:Tfp pilus assembly protein PilF
MSLLLDALKKSGHGQNVTASDGGTPPDTAPGFTLEELPTQSSPPAQPAQPIASKSEPARDAGKNLFAAKKAAPMKKKIKLGIVPLALIFATLFGSGYGYYVYLQIQPTPVARAVVSVPPPQPAPQQQAVAVIAPPITPLASQQTERPAIAAETRPSAPVHRHTSRTAQTFTIEKQQQVDTITPLLEAAYRAYRAGDFASAQKNYGEVLRQDANNHDALLGMATIAQQQGQDATAAQYYGQLLALDPRDALASAGISALGKGGQADKESRLKLLLEQQPQSSALHFALGNLYAEQSRWSEAQQSYFDAYSLQPDAAQYAYNLAISLDHLSQGKQAAQYYRRALQLDTSGNTNFDHTQAQHRLDELKAP